jgi:urea transport system ATP-binding protein
MLSIENISVAYGETLILRDVSLQVPAGKIVCLMGRNGVGKTTTLKSLMGLLPLRSGRIEFYGSDLTRTPPEVRACAGIGYVPQGREIFPQLTVEENLQVGLLANPERPRSIPPFVYDYFPILKDFLWRKGGVLSGGQQQQLAIARVLVAAPKLLVLDEPTEGIQPSIIQLIERVLRRLKAEGRVSVLLVEQYFEFAMKLADTYYVMEKGAIALSGKIAEMDKDVIKPYLAF